ncbi:MAG: sugar transferase [Christensenellaceae bacterium]
MYEKYVKRILDIVIALVCLPIVAVVVLICGIKIYGEDHGKIFYIANRLGKNGKVFPMYKLRTMKENAEDIRNEDGSTFNAEEDERLTKTGRFLRKTSIDELPQILNVLKGDMSFVGPRPDLPEHEQMYTDEERVKLDVKPGITGYSQAFFRNSIVWKNRLENDVFYVKNCSFKMDVHIIKGTIHLLIKKEGVYIQK